MEKYLEELVDIIYELFRDQQSWLSETTTQTLEYHKEAKHFIHTPPGWTKELPDFVPRSFPMSPSSITVHSFDDSVILLKELLTEHEDVRKKRSCFSPSI